jgi:hypothetical protein
MEENSCTFNTRGRLDVATFFVLHRGRRHESCCKACCAAKYQAG